MIKRIIPIGVLLLMLTGCLGRTTADPSFLMHQRLDDLQQRAQADADRGLYQEALPLLDEALRLASSLDDRPSQMAILVQKARLERQNGERTAAKGTIDQALALAGGSAQYAEAAQEKSLQELSAGCLSEAAAWAEKALQGEREGLVGRRLTLLARLKLLQGRYEQAGTLAEQALTDTSATRLASERANALRILGTVRGLQGRPAEGTELLNQALLLDKKLALPERIAADLEALAELARLQGDKGRQERFLNRAQIVRRAIQAHP